MCQVKPSEAPGLRLPPGSRRPKPMLLVGARHTADWDLNCTRTKLRLFLKFDIWSFLLLFLSPPLGRLLVSMHTYNRKSSYCFIRHMTDSQLLQLKCHSFCCVSAITVKISENLSLIRSYLHTKFCYSSSNNLEVLYSQIRRKNLLYFLPTQLQQLLYVADIDMLGSRCIFLDMRIVWT